MPAKLTIYIHLGFTLGLPQLVDPSPILISDLLLEPWANELLFSWPLAAELVSCDLKSRPTFSKHIFTDIIFQCTSRETLQSLQGWGGFLTNVTPKIEEQVPTTTPHNLPIQVKRTIMDTPWLVAKQPFFLFFSWLNKLSEARHRFDFLVTIFFRVIFKNKFFRRILEEF